MPLLTTLLIMLELQGWAHIDRRVLPQPLASLIDSDHGMGHAACGILHVAFGMCGMNGVHAWHMPALGHACMA